MNVSDLLKKLAAENHDALADLKPSDGCEGYVDFRGERHKGNFTEIRENNGTPTGVLQCNDYSVKCKFLERKIPAKSAEGIVFDPETGMFGCVLSDMTPCNGDPAYTQYHGHEFVGTLQKVTAHRGTGFLEPRAEDPAWGWHDEKHTRGLQVGYDHIPKWDDDRQMFFAGADAD